jgi:2-oxo-4-hydroxy-4-carboxy--5-ureidoimidazoline (OHCU) decarboxylase
MEEEEFDQLLANLNFVSLQEALECLHPKIQGCLAKGKEIFDGIKDKKEKRAFMDRLRKEDHESFQDLQNFFKKN